MFASSGEYANSRVMSLRNSVSENFEDSNLGIPSPRNPHGPTSPEQALEWERLEALLPKQDLTPGQQAKQRLRYDQGAPAVRG